MPKAHKAVTDKANLLTGCARAYVVLLIWFQLLKICQGLLDVASCGITPDRAALQHVGGCCGV